MPESRMNPPGSAVPAQIRGSTDVVDDEQAIHISRSIFLPNPRLAMDTWPCTVDEVAGLVAHLCTDRNAAGYAQRIVDRIVTPWRATVTGRAALGSLATIFVAFGSGTGERRASTLTGHARFLVREARAFWRDSTGDEAKFRLLEDYIADARAGRVIDRTITMLDDANGIRIVDGNKRAIAIYETTADADDVAVPVFILRPRVI